MRFEDGSDDYVDMGTAATALEISFPVTVSGWYNALNFDKTGTIFSSNFKAGRYSGYTCYIGTDGGLAARYGNNGGRNSSSRRTRLPLAGNEMSAGQWYHLSCVFKAFDDVEIYINSQNVSGGWDNGTANTIGYHGAGIATIGVWATGSGGASYPQGNIDDVRIYDRALSASEILQIYNATGG